MYDWDLEQQDRLRRLRLRRQEYRDRIAPRQAADGRLDDLGWEIFDFVAMHGGSATAAHRQAMDGNLRQRILVRDDLVARDRLRSEQSWRQLYGDRAALFDSDANEHLNFWTRRFTKPNFTYFIQEGQTGPVKIGRSTSVLKRLGDLQTGNPDDLFVRAVIPSEPQLERALHARFDPARIPGKEWFQGELVAAVLAFGAGLAERAVHSYDPNAPNSLPIVIGTQVRSATDLATIRRAIAVRLSGGRQADLLDRIDLTTEELYVHVVAMLGDENFSRIGDQLRSLLPVGYCLDELPSTQLSDEERTARAMVPVVDPSAWILEPRFPPRRQRRTKRG